MANTAYCWKINGKTQRIWQSQPDEYSGSLAGMPGARYFMPNIFLEQIASFTGASKRLELLASSDQTRVYRDFAHAPSKVKATMEAVKEQFPGSSN